MERVAELRLAAREEWDALRGGRLFLARELAPQGVAADQPDLFANGSRAGWVGSFDGYVVGYSFARTENLADGTLHGVVDELYVDASARSVGVGEAMMRALIDWFAERGCAGADAVALPGHRATKSFLEAGGFKARLIVLHRPFDPQP